MFGTPDELRTLLDLDATDLPDAQANLLLEMASAEVKAACGQELEQVVDDVAPLTGTVGSWLRLPQRPVTAVTAVTIDGAAIADYKVFGSRLWRSCGWAECTYEPSQVVVTYTHGYPPNDPRLELAKSVTLSLSAAMQASPDGTGSGYVIDDYRQTGGTATGGGARANELSPASVRLLRRTYGDRAGLVGIG